MKKYFILIFLACLIFVGGLVIFHIKNEDPNTSNILDEETTSKEIEIGIEKQSSNQEIMNDLLKHIGFAEEALGKFKITSPEEALNLWLEGTKSGNGVLQYSVMDSMLQQEFKTFLQHKENISWDTRVGELNIDKYEVVENIDVSEKVKIYKVRFDYINSQGELKERFNKLTIVEEQGKWVISSIR